MRCERAVKSAPRLSAKGSGRGRTSLNTDSYVFSIPAIA
jgi:hypothetical protein